MQVDFNIKFSDGKYKQVKSPILVLVDNNQENRRN